MRIDPTKSLNSETIAQLRKIGFYGDLAAKYLKEKLKAVDELCTCEFQDTPEQLIIIRGNWCIGTLGYGGMIHNYPTMVMRIDRPRDPTLTNEAFNKLTVFLQDFAKQHGILYQALYSC